MNLITYYENAIRQNKLEDVAAQRELLLHMQQLADDLSSSSWTLWGRKKQIKGLYIYGSVGVGKTFLVDLFYEFITEKKKARFHFHHFMQQIDAQLRRVQGKKDPLQHIARTIAKSTRVLCFDEFLINDVAYAMILAELLQVLSSCGVLFVISSNTAPDTLYLNGVHRERFLPAIALLKSNCKILTLDGKKDYRLGRQPLLNTYLFPLNEQTTGIMNQQFLYVGEQCKENGFITVQSRPINYIKRSATAIWFLFDILCNLPRSQLDYLEIAERFDTIFVSNIPILTANHTAQTIMLIHFIDVMYDRGIKIVISATVPLVQLYVADEMREPFKRTLSRLMEMQSIDYLSRHPRRIRYDLA